MHLLPFALPRPSRLRARSCNVVAWLWAWAWVMPALAASAPGPAETASAPTQARHAPAWRIVLVMGADPSLPAMRQFDEAFRRTLMAGSPGGATFFTEPLDAMRFNSVAIAQPFLALQRQKYAGQQVDLVMGVGDGAVDFVREHAGELWPGARVLMAALNVDLSPAERLPVGAPVLGFRWDVAGTIGLIERLQPDARRLVLVAGTAPYDQATLEVARRAVPAGGRWQVETWDRDTMESLRARAAGLDARTAVLFTSMVRDAQGRIAFTADAMANVAETSKAPIYGMFGTFIGRGAAAGQVIDFAHTGDRAGQMVLDLLNGRPAAGTDRITLVASRCSADHRQLLAYGLHADALPSDCDIRNLPRSLWTEYRGFVLAAAAVVLLQAATIALLLWQRRQRRLAEADALQRRTELSRAMRFAAIGELTASIAHEINQPLGAILSNADAADLLIRGGQATPEGLCEILADIRRDDLRAHEVIRRLRALLERHETQHLPLDLHPVLDDVLALLAPELRRRGMVLERAFSAGDDRLLGDAVQLQQVLLNLAINAMDAMEGTDPASRRLRVSTADRGESIELAVADRGSGVAEAVRGRVFDSFYTTKPRGLGLGLPIVRAIVEAHQGRIDVAPVPGGGAMFTVTLPRRVAPPQAAGDAPDAPRAGVLAAGLAAQP